MLKRLTVTLWLLLAFLLCVVAAYVFLAVDDRSSFSRGPGGGGEAFFTLIVWITRLVVGVVLVLCFRIRPRGEAWNGRVVII